MLQTSHTSNLLEMNNCEFIIYTLKEERNAEETFARRKIREI